MATLTIRMPDAKTERLKALAESRNISVNKLMEELATHAITAFDVEMRFRARAARGSPERGLALLDELDAYYGGGADNGAAIGLHETKVSPYDADPSKPKGKK